MGPWRIAMRWLRVSCLLNINTLWLILDWKLAKSISFDERFVLLWWLCNRLTSTAVRTVPFSFSSAEITSTRKKSPFEITFITYMREKSNPERLNNNSNNNNNSRRKKADCKRDLLVREKGRTEKDVPLFSLHEGFSHFFFLIGLTNSEIRELPRSRDLWLRNSPQNVLIPIR